MFSVRNPGLVWSNTDSCLLKYNESVINKKVSIYCTDKNIMRIRTERKLVLILRIETVGGVQLYFRFFLV